MALPVNGSTHLIPAYYSRIRICLNVVACLVRLQSVEFSAYRRSSPDRQVRQADECLRLQGTDVVVPRTLQRLFKASFFFFSGGGFSPQTYNFSPNGCQIVWSIFFGNNEFQIHHRNFLLVDSTRMKLFAIKQSKWCKFMPTHTHTHARTHARTRLTALCPGLPWWAGTRKVKPIWI